MASRDKKWKETLSKYLKTGKDSVQILTCGNLGVGKSALVNSLIGKQVAKEETSPLSSNLDIVEYTEIVESHGSSPTGRSITVKVWEAPGYAAIRRNVKGEEAISQKSKEADLILYCMDMRQRLDTQGLAIDRLTAGNAPDIWRHAVFALTFANEIRPRPGSSEEPEEYFKCLFTEWKEEITKLLSEDLNVPEEIVKAIPIIPTGYRGTPPPDRSDWLSPFWEAAFSKFKKEAQPALLDINMERIVSGDRPPEPLTKPPGEELEPHEQPIHLSEDFQVGRSSRNSYRIIIAVIVVAAGFGALLGVMGCVRSVCVGVAGLISGTYSWLFDDLWVMYDQYVLSWRV